MGIGGRVLADDTDTNKGLNHMDYDRADDGGSVEQACNRCEDPRGLGMCPSCEADIERIDAAENLHLARMLAREHAKGLDIAACRLDRAARHAYLGTVLETIEALLAPGGTCE